MTIHIGEPLKLPSPLALADEVGPHPVVIEAPAEAGPPTDDAPLGATPMRCCGTWEEDENAVDWSTGRGGHGFLHHPGKQCR